MTSRPWRIAWPVLRDSADVLDIPNRIQRFPVVLILALATLAAGWLYLGLTLRSAAVGLKVQAVQNQSASMERDNALLELKIGELGSQEAMVHRAAQLGFEVRQPEYLLLEAPLPPHDARPEVLPQPVSTTR
jgi:hypothetical protein